MLIHLQLRSVGYVRYAPYYDIPGLNWLGCKQTYSAQMATSGIGLVRPSFNEIRVRSYHTAASKGRAPNVSAERHL